MKPLQVGLLGIGTVGSGTWTVLRAQRGGDHAPRGPADPHHVVAERALDRAREAHARRRRRQPDRRRGDGRSRIRTSTSSSS